MQTKASKERVNSHNSEAEINASNNGPAIDSGTRLNIDSNEEIQMRKARLITQAVNMEEKQIQNEVKTKNKQYSECPVCFSQCKKVDFQMFSGCQHSFCPWCMKENIQLSIRNFKVIKCMQDGCPQILQMQSTRIKSISLTQQQKYYKILVDTHLLKNQNIKICPSVGCEGFVVINQNPVTCFQCKKQFCRHCMMVAHNGDCNSNKVAIFLQKKYNFRRCSQCKMVVQKSEGCNHMTCKCGYQFCYLCGNKYQPNHKCEMPKVNGPLEVNEHQISMIGLANQLNPEIEAMPRDPDLNQNQAVQQQIPCTFARVLKMVLKYILMSIIVVIVHFISGEFLLVLVYLSYLHLPFFFGVWLGIKQFAHFACVYVLLGNIFLLIYCIGKNIIIFTVQYYSRLYSLTGLITPYVWRYFDRLL